MMRKPIEIDEARVYFFLNRWLIEIYVFDQAKTISPKRAEFLADWLERAGHFVRTMNMLPVADRRKTRSKR